MLAVSECDNNYSKLINLRKDHSIVFNSIIDIPTNYFVESLNKTHQSYYESQSGPEYNTFKIGFIFISKNEFNPLTQTLRNLAAIKRKDGKVIWSELINIEYSVYKWHSE
jgi:hypothetical protein